MVTVFILSAFLLNGQTIYLDKKVSLPTGQISLKVAFNSISSQSGCVFSYDPTKIAENQQITIASKKNQTLRTALSEILPKTIQYKMNGKYIVLQEVIAKIPTKSITNASPHVKNKTADLNRKGNGTISKNPVLEQLVLPPLPTISETQPRPQKIDSVIVTQNQPVPLQVVDTNLIVAVDTVSKKPIQPAFSSNNDTTKVKKPNLGDFLKKNGYLESGISINNQLAAFSVHAGLYNFYSIFSIATDYNDSYLYGFGAGANIKIDNHFSVNCDLLQNSLIAGKSYLLQVRASNTQFIPVLNYSLSSFKFFAGPTVNLIKSSYVSSISSTDLGLLVGIGFSIGVKVDLKNLFFKQI